MSARLLLALFDSVYVLSMAGMVGGIVFFTFVVAPTIFVVLGAESGGRFVRALFPRYYLWNAILGAVALPAYVAGPLCFPEYRGPSVGVQSTLLLAIILVMLYGGNSLVPAINRARDEGPASGERFNRLHRRSVVLNAAAMIAGIGLLIAYACRPAPRTTGIVELSPVERARREAEFYESLRDRGTPPASGARPAPDATGTSGGMHPGKS